MRRREFILALGGAAAWPLAVHAQRAEKTYRVGYLALLSGEDATLGKTFSQRLQELGYSAGRNLMMEYRSAEGRPERRQGARSHHSSHAACHCRRGDRMRHRNAASSGCREGRYLGEALTIDGFIV
jgi:hypothetical protein